MAPVQPAARPAPSTCPSHMLRAWICPDPTRRRSPRSPGPPSGGSTQSPSRKQGWEHPLSTDNRVRGGKEPRGFTKQSLSPSPGAVRRDGSLQGILGTLRLFPPLRNNGAAAPRSSVPRRGGDRPRSDQIRRWLGLGEARPGATVPGDVIAPIVGCGAARSGRQGGRHAGRHAPTAVPRQKRAGGAVHRGPVTVLGAGCIGLQPARGLGVPKIPVMASASSQSCSARPPECRPSLFFGGGWI